MIFVGCIDRYADREKVGHYLYLLLRDDFLICIGLMAGNMNIMCSEFSDG